MLLLLDTRYSFNHSLFLAPPNLLTVSPKEAGSCQNLWIPSLGFHSRGFGQSNSLPTASSVGGGMGRRNPRQYQIASRNVPSARLGLLGTSGFVSSNQRHTAANPTIMKQGRQVCFALGRSSGAEAFKMSLTQTISRMERGDPGGSKPEG